METNLLDLPQVCLEEIFKKLRFAEISRLGATCKYFREIAKTIFRLYFRNIERTIELEMVKTEMEADKPENLSISEHLHLALLHSMLRILLSEAKMLKAHCWRYMRDPSYDFCFPAGLILDEFERILLSVRQKTLKKDKEPEITTTLFHLGESFYDYFDFNIETQFQESSRWEVQITSESNRCLTEYGITNRRTTLTRLPNPNGLKNEAEKLETSKYNILNQCGKNPEQNKCFCIFGDVCDKNEKTLFGVKILDILNSCALSNFHTLLSHQCNNEGFKLKAHYELRDINVLEALPTIGLSLATSEKQLIKICRYIRNNVRWTNLFHPLQDFWMLEDAIEINRNVGTASALLRQWKLQRTSSRLNLNNDENHILQYDHRKIINRFKNRFGLIVSASLECPTLHNIPLTIDNCLRSKCFVFGNLSDMPKCNSDCGIPIDEFSNLNKHSQTDMEKWNRSITTYKFHLELKIQYPSFLSETVKEAILKVDQVGEKTTVSTDGDDMRKSATYRADENDD